MSKKPKLTLWQKLKRLLTSAAPQAIIVAVDERQDLSPVDAAILAEPNHQAKASLTKPADDDSTMPIVDYLKRYLEDKQWHYSYYQPRKNDPQQSHHLCLRMRSKELDCSYLFRVQEKNALLAVYGILPFTIPESHHHAAMLLITQINYDMLIGNLELDTRDGELRYKNAIDVEAVGINDVIIDYLLQSVIAMTSVAHEIFSDLIDTQDPSEDMATLLSELRLQADARVFFLPSQKMQ